MIGSLLEYDTENMNSEEIYSSLRGVTEAIQSFSYRSQEDLNEPMRRDGKKDEAVSSLCLVPALHCMSLIWIICEMGEATDYTHTHTHIPEGRQRE